MIQTGKLSFSVPRPCVHAPNDGRMNRAVPVHLRQGRDAPLITLHRADQADRRLVLRPLEIHPKSTIRCHLVGEIATVT